MSQCPDEDGQVGIIPRGSYRIFEDNGVTRFRFKLSNARLRRLVMAGHVLAPWMSHWEFIGWSNDHPLVLTGICPGASAKMDSLEGGTVSEPGDLAVG